MFNPKPSNCMFKGFDEETPGTHPAKETGGT